MSADVFDKLLKLVGPYIQKQNTQMRDSIPAEERLIVTLRFLATGRSYECLKFSSGISPQSLGRIIPETCRVIYEVLQKEYMKFPTTTAEWKKIAEDFDTRWQFPNCGGAMDGKHIRIACPPNTGELYYNYKKIYSIVLMALVNANYEFVYADVGKNGRNSDGGILEYTKFYDKLINDQLNIPQTVDNIEHLNFVFVGDEAFALHSHILKPFSQVELTYEKRIFNYRLSRARNVVENVFGIVASRFRVLHTTIALKPENTTLVIMAICALHNFLRRNSASYFSQKSVDSEDKSSHELRKDGDWRTDTGDFYGLQNLTRNMTLEAKRSRDRYLHYFNGDGSVPWQHAMVAKGKA
ncbi:uncharacterized protein LOC113388523 [Ctenocephalides felis]|uniref:uncharacterized protein LOC113388523 n=1 Tax=Ctenocephalides felis TaxID=7515 RepID=UPI000E6E381A|nr:uncharacterized protein LOC113388523 [Ctenocephalides felis]